MARKKFVGELHLLLDDGSQKIIPVQKQGGVVFLDQKPVHLGNRGSVEGWIQEPRVWGWKIKEYKYKPSRLIKD